MFLHFIASVLRQNRVLCIICVLTEAEEGFMPQFLFQPRLEIDCTSSSSLHTRGFFIPFSLHFIFVFHHHNTHRVFFLTYSSSSPSTSSHYFSTSSCSHHVCHCVSSSAHQVRHSTLDRLVLSLLLLWHRCT